MTSLRIIMFTDRLIGFAGIAPALVLTEKDGATAYR
jgi:hypothetical protein